MAMIDTPRTAPFGAISIFRATTYFTSIVDAVTLAVGTKLDEYRTAQALSRLSPAMLDDIGLTQADVDSYRVRAGHL